MQIGAATSWTFSALGNPKAKAILLGPVDSVSADLIETIRSFPIEHVSPELLLQQEISRQSNLATRARASSRQGTALTESYSLALLRKWFWSRKPDAGFVLTNFPATLLHALLLDEWLDARGESLTFCAPLPSLGARVQDCPPQYQRLMAYYDSLGLLGSLQDKAA